MKRKSVLKCITGAALLLAPVIGLMLLGCENGSNSPSPAVTSVTVTPAATELEQGTNLQFTAAVVVKGDAANTVTWEIGETTKPGTGITADGLLTVANDEPLGTLTITASSTFDTGKSGSAAVTVIAPVPVNGVIRVTVSPKDTSVDKGSTKQLTADVETENDTVSKSVIWEILEDADEGTYITGLGVLTVSPEETLTTLTIRASSTASPGKYDTAAVTITVPSSEPTVLSVTVSPNTVEVEKGTTRQFQADVVVSGGAADTVTWTVSGGITETTISDAGLLTVASGETAASLTVTAASTADTAKSDTAAVTVTAPVTVPGITSVAVSPKTVSVQKGTTQQFAAAVAAVGGAADTVTWTVSGGITDTTISDTGLLTLAAGETAATVTVTVTSTFDTTKSDTATVTVTTTPVPKATVANVSIPGTAGLALAAPAAAEVKITLTDETFKDAILQGDVVTTWFTGMPAGSLAAKAASNANAGGNSISIAITGTPSAASSAVLAINIPADALTASTTALTVQSNAAAKFAIALAPPTANPLGATGESTSYTAYYSTNPEVELSAPEGADIWYTTDGTDPTGAAPSTKYTGAKISVPIVLLPGTSLKAIAVKTGLVNSPVFTARYVLRPREATPAVTINYEKETLDGFLNTQTTYFQYTGFTEDAYLSGSRAGLSLTGTLNNYSASISSLLKPTSQWIAIVRGANTTPLGNGTRDSEPQFIDLPARPAAPAALGTVKVTEPDATDGKITGTTAAMEYKLSSATNWTACTGAEVTGLAKGDYLVRFKALTTGDTKSFASAQEMVTIEPPAPSPYGIWMGDTKVSGAETLTDALVYFNTASNYQSTPTNYTLKLAAGTEMISTQTRLWGGANAEYTAGFQFYTGSTLTIEGPDDGRAVIQNPNAASWILIENITLVLKSNITFKYTGTATNNEPLIDVTKGTLEMNTRVLITGNLHTGNGSGGGGVRVDDGIFNMKGGEISGNSSGRGGGGVAVYNKATFNMSGGKIVGNSTITKSASGANVVSGGGVGVNSQAKFVKTGGIIMGSADDTDGAKNTVTGATTTGAAVFVNNSAVSGTTTGGYPHRDGKVAATDNISYDGLEKEEHDSFATLGGTWD
ncbi:FN3 associated domain-containing protein [Treponema primitia]|uniref:FN3 associated domain-containing protein n=1 Tax=Treponema primitia TaxID=88058 RepID=UPI00025553AF|nr:chitobiase/beta-hexosaminidase C-terminal domain-containing protein [Treponema primitia]